MTPPQLPRPGEERRWAHPLRRFGVAPAFLHHHDVKRLVHIDSELDRARADINLPAGFSSEDNSFDSLSHYSYLPGVGPMTRTRQLLTCHLGDAANRWPAYCPVSLYEHTSPAGHARSRQRWLILFSLDVMITRTVDDDSEFIEIASRIREALFELYHPAEVYVVHMDNWFDISGAMVHCQFFTECTHRSSDFRHRLNR